MSWSMRKCGYFATALAVLSLCLMFIINQPPEAQEISSEAGPELASIQTGKRTFKFKNVVFALVTCFHINILSSFIVSYR